MRYETIAEIEARLLRQAREEDKRMIERRDWRRAAVDYILSSSATEHVTMWTENGLGRHSIRVEVTP